MLSDSHGQFHLFLTFPSILFSQHAPHVSNKPFESLSDCLCMQQSARSRFLLHCYLYPDHSKQISLCVFALLWPWILWLSLGLGGIALSTQKRDTIPMPPPCKHNNWAEYCKLPPLQPTTAKGLFKRAGVGQMAMHKGCTIIQKTQNQPKELYRGIL